MSQYVNIVLSQRCIFISNLTRCVAIKNLLHCHLIKNFIFSEGIKTYSITCVISMIECFERVGVYKK